MSHIPADAQKIEVVGSTVDFFKLSKDSQSTYYFDTSKCGPPDPMVNAVCGLKLIKGTNDKLVMINHKAPAGLLNKLADDVIYESQTLEDGLTLVTFSSNNEATTSSDLDHMSH